MPFQAFPTVLLDDPREPIPGMLAIQFHHRIERELARADRRPPLAAESVRDRATAVRRLLEQGLTPTQIRALGRHGLELGRETDPHSLASLARHLEAYLAAVEAAGFLEPSLALWEAAARQRSGQPGAWLDRHPEDGPLACGVRDLAPTRLRLLCALPELGTVRFMLPTARGRGEGGHGLFANPEPHLIRMLLPGLESLGAWVDHLEIETPEGWAENPWGGALDGLFTGPLELDEPGRAGLRRAILPTEPAVWRAAVEQVCAWVAEGLPPEEITLIHPAPEQVGAILQVGLAAEGIPLQSPPPGPMLQGRVWGPLVAVLRGLCDHDPAQLAAGLGGTREGGLGGRTLHRLADMLEVADQSMPGLLTQTLARLPGELRVHAGARGLNRLDGLATAKLRVVEWLEALDWVFPAIGVRRDREDFALVNLMAEAWAGATIPVSLAEFGEVLTSGLEVMRPPVNEARTKGVVLVAPSALDEAWRGSEATLVLDLGEGAWPRVEPPLPDLDLVRQVAINRALRRMAEAGEGEPDFPPGLQTFALPQTEEGEVLPRAFHRAAFGFGRALALTRRAFVALTSDRDAEGRLRGQGQFWTALEGAGAWQPDPDQAASTLRVRWAQASPDPLTSARQRAVGLGLPGPATTLARSIPAEDRTPWTSLPGDSAENPISPTLLEALARCPYRAHAEKALRLQVWTEDGSVGLELGTLAHALLEGILSGLEGEPHWPAALMATRGLPDLSEAALLACLRDIWEARREALLAGMSQLDPGQILRLQLATEALLPRLAAVLRRDALESAPTKVELEMLGLSPVEGAWTRQLLSQEAMIGPVQLPLPVPLWVGGRVDRLERWSCGAVQFVRIVDYKTSAISSLKAYADDDGWAGAHLQLPMYQILASATYAWPVSAVLLSLREVGAPVPMMLPTHAPALRQRLLDHVAEFTARARAGVHPAIPGPHCAGCSLSAVCGRPVDLEALVEEDAE